MLCGMTGWLLPCAEFLRVGERGRIKVHNSKNISICLVSLMSLINVGMFSRSCSLCQMGVHCDAIQYIVHHVPYVQYGNVYIHDKNASKNPKKYVTSAVVMCIMKDGESLSISAQVPWLAEMTHHSQYTILKSCYMEICRQQFFFSPAKH